MEEKKKVTFEPVSAEEAKKIRANGGGERFYSDTESGSGDIYSACFKKKKNDPCTVAGGGSGTCQYNADKTLFCSAGILS